MGREVRMVPANWKHPTEFRFGELRHVALYDGADLKDDTDDWDAEAAKWAAGEYPDYASEEGKKQSYSEWAGERPDPADYMPVWPDAERTHCMMYETTSEGSPISPAFAAPEELARWLADNDASSLGPMKATYEQWLRVCKGGFTPSFIVDASGLRSGVEALGDK